MLKIMPFVKNLRELLTIFMHFHLLLKQLFHITNTTFCHWPALKINSVYYSKNYSYSPLVYKEVCVYAHVAGIQHPSTFYSEQQEALCVSMNGLEQSQIQRWKKTPCWSDCWLQERNSSSVWGRPLLLVPSTWEFCKKWWKKKTRKKKGKEKREE